MVSFHTHKFVVHTILTLYYFLLTVLFHYCAMVFYVIVSYTVYNCVNNMLIIEEK